MFITHLCKEKEIGERKKRKAMKMDADHVFFNPLID